MDEAEQIEQVRRTWRYLACGRVEVNYIPDRERGGGTPRVLFATSEDELVKIALDKPANQMVAMGINPRPPHVRTFGTNADILVVKNIVMDIDPEMPAGTRRPWDAPVDHERKAAAFRFVESELLPYFVGLGIGMPHVADSGHGPHLLFALPEISLAEHPLIGLKIVAFFDEVRGQFREVLSKLALKIDGTSDLRRVIKLYGTAKPGGPVSVFGEAVERREDHALRDHILKLTAATERTLSPIDLDEFKESDIPEGFHELLKRDARLHGAWDGTLTDIRDTSRSGQTWHLAKRAARQYRIHDPQALGSIIYFAPHNEAKWSERGARAARAYIKQTVAKILGKFVEDPSGPTGSEAPAPASESTDPGTSAGGPEPTEVPGKRPAHGRDGFIHECGAARYRISNMRKSKDEIRASVELIDAAGAVLDQANLPLDSDHRRRSFAARVAKLVPAISPEEAEKHLLQMRPLVVQAISETRAKSKHHPEDPVAALSVTPEVLKAARKMLRSPNLMKLIVRDVRKMGHVGEPIGKRLVYLVATSRKMNKGLALLIQAQSASGKSYIAEKVEALMPREEILPVTSLSPQALVYMGEEGMSHKFVRIAEHLATDDNTQVYLYLRELLSSGSIKRRVVMKSESGGPMESVELTASGPIALIETTTQLKIHEENATRMWVYRIDETREKTKRINAAHLRSKTLEGLREAAARPAIQAKHWALQRMLEPFDAIVLPYADKLEFPDRTPRTRRDLPQFTELISASAFLHQKQRKVITEGDKRILFASPRDYEIAYKIAIHVLRDSMSDVPPAAMDLFRLLKAAAKSRTLKMRARRPGSSIKDAFTVKDARAVLGKEWSISKIHNCINELDRNDLVEVLDTGHGKLPKVMRLLAAPGPEKVGVTTPSALNVKLVREIMTRRRARSA